MADRYKNITPTVSSSGKRHRRNVIYPDIPVTENDIYVISTGTDRYDTLAKEFYGDSSLWWIIASANNFKKDGLIPTAGKQLRIPANGQDIKADFYEFNEKR